MNRRHFSQAAVAFLAAPAALIKGAEATAQETAIVEALRRHLRRYLPEEVEIPSFAALSESGQVTANEKEILDVLRDSWRKFVPEGVDLPSASDKVRDEEWRELLPEPRYQVLFEADTEPAWSSELLDVDEPGVFICAACDLPLFTTPMKFHSGTGWPSFFTFIPGTLETELDFSLIWPRTEYHCVRCGGHQGHVFEDWPTPSGLRYCNNGLALQFLDAQGGSGMQQEAALDAAAGFSPAPGSAAESRRPLGR